MGTSYAFKISGSLVKPTRESVLDYCSYCMIILSLIGICRVLIGGSDFKEGCTLNSPTIKKQNVSLDRASKNVIKRFAKEEEYPSTDAFTETNYQNISILYVTNSTFAKISQKENVSSELVTSSSMDSHNAGGSEASTTREDDTRLTEMTSTQTWTNIGDKFQSVPTVGTTLSEEFDVPRKEVNVKSCQKYYQAMFAYTLLIESLLLLLSGLLWVKVPRVSNTLSKFTKLIHLCQRSDWATRAIHVMTNRRTVADLSQSLYSFMSSEYVNYDMRSLLDTLFHPDSEYHAKAKARHLYEKVQIFCASNSKCAHVWHTYVIKTSIQFFLWIVIFNMNLVLFVLLQFYVKCPEEPGVACEHDEFLRIIWFMAQTLVIIYGLLNCKTLKWINERAVVKRDACCRPMGCFHVHSDMEYTEHVPVIKIRPYRYESNQPVYNDMSLLLLLLEEAHPKTLPYFIVFMFNEWKEKLTSFAQSVQSSELPIRSSMQMLSGRPPPTIQITDLSFPPRTCSLPSNSSLSSIKHNKLQKGDSLARNRPSVSFYLESESTGSDGNEYSSTGRQRNPSSDSRHSLTPPSSRGKGGKISRMAQFSSQRSKSLGTDDQVKSNGDRSHYDSTPSMLAAEAVITSVPVETGVINNRDTFGDGEKFSRELIEKKQLFSGLKGPDHDSFQKGASSIVSFVVDDVKASLLGNSSSSESMQSVGADSKTLLSAKTEYSETQLLL